MMRYTGCMRTTLTLDPEVQAAVDALRAKEGVGPSEAVNRLVRNGLRRTASTRAPFRQRTANLGARLPLDDVADVLDTLDEGDAR